MDKITDKIYLGDCFGADNEEKLKQNNIKRVYSCCGHLSRTYEDKSIIQRRIELSDTPRTNIIKYFKDAIKFIDESDKVFVHCFAGVSRSATLVIAYLMWRNHVSYQEALQFVNKYRTVQPNGGFEKQLLIFEQKLNEKDYNLDLIDLDSVVWPPKEGLPFYLLI